MRLQKFMADAGVASRRKCEEYISSGRVAVNGEIARIGCAIDPARDVVLLDGMPLTTPNKRYILAFNKPAYVMSTSSDPEGRETVLDYFKDFDARLYSVGRLDYDSEGLLIMTNDGDMAYRMSHPKFMLDKTYHAVCAGRVTDEGIQALAKGVMLDDGMACPAKIEAARWLKNGNTALTITIHEGRNREVRRMLSAVGHDTLLLRRIRIGPIELGDLPSGRWRPISDAEREALDALLR